jgi:hypothetical protein
MTDKITCHDFEEIQKFDKYLDLIAVRRKENKKNGIKWSADNATRIMAECYKVIYG